MDLSTRQHSLTVVEAWEMLEVKVKARKVGESLMTVESL
jgi:hypothetical protein